MTDVLLPSNPIDLRFHQQRYFSIPGAALDRHAAPLLDFVQRSDLRPWEGELATPPRVNGLRFPKRLFSAPVNNNNNNNNNNTEKGTSSTDDTDADDDTNNDLIEVDYMFASLEMQRVVTADFRGFKVGYRSIEAGQRGGKHAELFLDAVSVERSRAHALGELSAPETICDAESFVDAASQLAAGNGDFRWIGHD
jgi:hypothetical protein